MNRVKRTIGDIMLREDRPTGKGICVAVLDTGTALHPDFGNRITGFADMVNHRNGPYDDCGHGTHICGIIGGNGRHSSGLYSGIAPECRLAAVKVLDRRGNGYTDHMLEGLDWILDRKDKLGIRIINISVGAGGRERMRENSALIRGVEQAWDAGLVVVAAAGNNGPERMTVTTPGISRKVITVGCSDDDREILVNGKRMVDYSGRGPTVSCICKPDVVAPGFDVISCGIRNGNYVVKSGTSMSTAVVSGAVALLLEREPDMSNLDVKLRLRDSCTDLGKKKNQQGWGLLDLRRLLKI